MPADRAHEIVFWSLWLVVGILFANLFLILGFRIARAVREARRRRTLRAAGRTISAYLDGFELLKALRTDPATQPIPVIVLTGRTDDETYARARKLGVADFFTKPVERDQLIRSIERLLAPRRTDPGAR